MNNLENFLLASKDRSVDYKVVYDIGAHKGEFSEVVKKHFPETKIHLFEPNTKHNKEMEKQGTVHNITLWKEYGEMDFYSIGESGDSLYIEMSGLYDEVAPKRVPVQPLDGYVKDNNLEYPDLIKLDTQGSELDILAGGLECLSNATMVILELSLLPYNLAAPKFDDYMNFMAELDYFPIALTEVHYLNGIVVQIDLAFVNTNKGAK